ncbi:hypothetical protein [Streptomyces sp. HNM0645]|uniref:hypothetical protein n=1 Tax=Streptomyces sp. HNM0645 TaxID=2782343 RepID=UPI0032D59B97
MLGRPDHLRQQADLSLRRLRLECVEFVQLHRSPVLLPIPGTSSVSHLRANMASADISLTAEHLTLLDEA